MLAVDEGHHKVVKLLGGDPSPKREPAVENKPSFCPQTLNGDSSTADAVTPADGQLPAFTSSDNPIILWKQDNEPLAEVLAHTEAVWAVVFSPNGQWLATAAGDENKVISRLNTWELLSGALASTINVWALFFSAHSRIFAKWATDRVQIRRQ
jgi:WD40 repeat protein